MQCVIGTLQKSGSALGEEFVEGVFEEEAFEAVARVARGGTARAAFGVGDVAAFAYDAEREAVKERTGAVKREVDRVVGERADLEAKSGGVPRGVEPRGERIYRVVKVDGEVEQPTGREHARKLAGDFGGQLGVVYDVVAEDDVEGGVGEGKALARGGDGLRAPLPSREERGVVAGERVATHAACRPEKKTSPVAPHPTSSTRASGAMGRTHSSLSRTRAERTRIVSAASASCPRASRAFARW